MCVCGGGGGLAHVVAAPDPWVQTVINLYGLCSGQQGTTKYGQEMRANHHHHHHYHYHKNMVCPFLIC